MALDAVKFMRTRARGSPSWPGARPRGRIRWRRLISSACTNPLRTGRAIRFKRLDRARILGRVTRASTHMREAKRLEELADCTFVVGDPEPLENDALQVDPTPAHHTVQGLVRPRCNEFGYLDPLIMRQARLGTLGPAVQKTLGAMPVEPMDPVAKRLPVHAADPGSLGPVHPVQNRSQ